MTRDLKSTVRSPAASDRPAEGGTRPPDVSVVVPVNAQGDLENVETLLADLGRYRGSLAFETILVVNNFPEDEVPPAVERLRERASKVLTIPDVRRPGEAVGFSARIPGIRAAASDVVLLFDADCRIPNPGALLEWYAAAFRRGAHAAYTGVGYHDFERAASVWVAFSIHHTARWLKRCLMRIPTTRGSNYAVRKDVILRLYDEGYLADEMNVGPTIKRLSGPVAYGGRRRLRVLTSGRMFEPGWKWILPHFLYRLRYNLRVLPVREGVARVTGRERDPVRRYEGNRPIRS